MKRFHYAWVICLACLWLFICNMGLCSNILTLYLPFIEATGISDSMGSAILSVRCFSSFITTFFVGIFYQKFSLRTGILLASLTGAAGALVFALGGNAFIYYIGAMLAGIAYGAGCVYPVSLLLTNWFHARKGLAVGISFSGSGVAMTFFSPLLSHIILQYSLRTAFLFQAFFMVVSAVLVFLFVRDLPSEKSMSAFGEKPNPQKSTSSATDSAPLPKNLLAMLAIMMVLNGGAGLAFSGHLSVLTRTSGYSAELAASMFSLFGMVIIFSKLASGALADRIGVKNCSTILILTFILGCFLVIGMNGVNTFFPYALAVMLGIGASIYNTGPPLWASDLSKGAQYGKTLKWLQIFYNLGGIIFTAVPGIIADHTGEYQSSYFLFAGMMAVSLLILLWTYRWKKNLTPTSS